MKTVSRSEITRQLSVALEKYIDPLHDARIYWAKEVTFDYCTAHKTRVDYMLFEPENTDVSGLEHGVFKCYEVKSSVEDFRSGHGHNFYGDYNYYVMMPETFSSVKDEIGRYVGVLVMDKGKLVSMKKAKRCTRKKSLAEMLFAMWRSSRRDLIKIYKNAESGE